jgi:uncharacterized protein YecT (DUF1311 family)
MIECAWIDAEKADRELNRQWLLTVRAINKMDKEVDAERGPGFRHLDAYKHLLSAQRAWIAYRDAECAIEADQMAGGQDDTLVYARCNERLIRDRIGVLKELGEGRR